ncbi:hypothetical protein MMC31_005461 [Peltigera leucophlebia]|nr:hypothetical protein [Peltigera leucophlebia]
MDGQFVDKCGTHNQTPDDSALINNKPTNKAGYFRFNRILFCKTFVRCLATTIFIAFVIATLRIYEKKGNFTQHQKTTFNAIITFESLCLGLNFFDSFKELANVLRWKILKRYERRARMHPVSKDLILAIESLISVARLGWAARSIPWLCIFCIAWILFNLLAQTSIALINLTYNLNDGTNWKDTYLQNGIVSASNLSCYFHPHTHECLSEDVVQGLANAYGMSPPIFNRGTYDQIQDVVKSTENYGYFCRNTPGECTYRMVEYNPSDQQRTYPLFTSRTITASTGQCFKYWETENRTLTKDTSGNPGALEFKIFNGSVHDSIIIPQQLGGVDSTTYIYRGIHPPQNTTELSCGNRCLWMWAHKSEGQGENSTFYECPITISTVSNTKTDAQIVPDSVAKLAASSIALQGRWAVNGSSTERIWTQFRFYPYGDDMELHSQNDSKAGANMVEFAIRSLSTMAFRNPSVQVPGLVPHLGTSLQVYWKYVGALCGSIVFVQFVLSVFVYWSYVEPP